MENLDEDNTSLQPAAEALSRTFNAGNTSLDMGRLFNTRGAALQTNPKAVASAIVAHAMGNWGKLDPEDAAMQNNSLKRRGGTTGHFLSVWVSSGEWNGHKDVTFWIITEGHGSDRRTTILLPDEY